MFHFFKKRWQTLKKGVITAGVASIVFLTLGTNVFMIQKRDEKTPIRIKTAQTEHRLRVSLASTPEERSMGLMWVKKLPKNGGKLFVFETPEKANFWMKNMSIPLDILYIGSDFKIQHIVYEAPPCPKGTVECPTYSSPEPVQYVLELPSGYAKSHLVQVGDGLLLGH